MKKYLYKYREPKILKFYDDYVYANSRAEAVKIAQNKIKKFSQQKPLLFVLAVCVIYCLFLNIPSPRFSVFPDNMLRSYVSELYHILWPVALSLLFGFRFIYHRKGFGPTLIAGMFLIVLHTAILVLFLFDAFDNGVQWQTTSAIFLASSKEPLWSTPASAIIKTDIEFLLISLIYIVNCILSYFADK